MRDWTRRVLLLVVLAALVAAAYAPLARAGFVGADLPVLAAASRAAWPAEPVSVRAAWAGFVAGDVPPLGAASLALSSRMWSDAGHWSPSDAVWLRVENLLLLLVAGWAVGRTVRRALVPWCGSEVARSASWASASMLAPHPLCVSSVASPAARGDLLGLALCGLAAIVFLRARQETRPAGVFFAVLLGALAALASEFALFLPFVLAVVEFASSRRLRAPSARLRTTATTFAVFLAIVSMPTWLSLLANVDVKAPALVASAASLFQGDRAMLFARGAVEKLGVLLLPVPHEIDRRVGYAIAAVAALLALQPAFAAARSAPRLWGWILVAWCASIVLALLFAADVRVTPGNLTNATVLLPATIATAAGFAVTSTALSGVRRALLPIVIASGYAILAHAASTVWPRASAALSDLERDVARAQELDGGAAQIFVLDPLERVAGLEVAGAALPLLVDAAFANGADASTAPSSPFTELSLTQQSFTESEHVESGGTEPQRAVRSLSADALFALAREPEFGELRQRGVVLVRPQDTGARAAGQTSIALAVPQTSDAPDGPFLWRGESRSPLLNLDPSLHRAVRVTALPGTSTAESPRMEWRSRSEVFANGAIDGVWIEGVDGPVALFDLGRSLAWLAGEQIRRIWFQRGLSDIVSAEVLADVPVLASDIAPRVEGSSWIFPSPSGVPVALHGEPRWIVGALDLTSYRYREFDAAATSPEISFTDAGAWERAILDAGGGPIAWSLECRVGETALARARDRRTVR